jgi:RNA polymerase sigma-70 factor (ECF subfamily)
VDQVQRAAFERLMLPHLDDAYNLARWLTGNRSDAEDVVQEAYLKAMKHFATFRGPAARPWLLTIVRRCCFSWLRINRPHQLVFTDNDAAIEMAEHSTVVSLYPNTMETPEATLADKELRAKLHQAVADLPPHYREIIVLRELQDCSYREIGEIAGIPIGTVMSRLARARDHLAKLMEGEDGRGTAHGL